MKFEQILLRVLSEYGIIGIVLMVLLYNNILRLKADLKDREHNREYLKNLIDTVNKTNEKLAEHTIRIKALEKKVPN
ncbi:MAG: hypothetical protein ACRC0S_01960 [Fusobacteriaceae bacterium]